MQNRGTMVVITIRFLVQNNSDRNTEKYNAKNESQICQLRVQTHWQYPWTIMVSLLVSPWKWVGSWKQSWPILNRKKSWRNVQVDNFPWIGECEELRLSGKKTNQKSNEAYHLKSATRPGHLSTGIQTAKYCIFKKESWATFFLWIATNYMWATRRT